MNNMVLFDKATYDKLLSEAPKYKLITPSVLSDRLRVLLLSLFRFIDVDFMGLLRCGLPKRCIFLWDCIFVHFVFSCLKIFEEICF